MSDRNSSAIVSGDRPQDWTPTLTENQSNTMRAVIWEGKPYNVSLKNVPKPKLVEKEDAIVRITSAAICGSDLHTYRGLFGSANPPWPLGHEAIGIVTAVGSAINAVKIGDRVIVPGDVSPGHFTLEPFNLGDDPIFGFGPEFGDLGGCQAEYVRVPHADDNLIIIPHYPFREFDYLFISDIWATAWTCLDFSGFEAGDTVAVFGAGPVGLLCAYSALFRGASKVYLVDHNEKRLEKGASIGAIPINFMHNNAAEQILALEPNGVNRSCDCCGQEALNVDLKHQQNAILLDMVHVTKNQGGIGVIGVYSHQENAPGRPRASEWRADLAIPMAEMWTKGLSMKSGIVDVLKLAPKLVELVKSGRGKPSFIVSSVIGIEDAEEAYRRFEEGKETKVVIRFPWANGE